MSRSGSYQSGEKNQHIVCNHGLTVGAADAGGAGGPDFTPAAVALCALTGREITANDIESNLGNDGPPDCDDIINAATSIDVTVEQLIEAGLPVPPGLECDFL